MYLKLFNIAFWCLPFIQMTGLGLFLLKAFGFSISSYKTILRSFWLGMAGLIVLLGVLHLFWPVNGGVVLFILILSLLGLVLSAGELLQTFKSTSSRDMLFVVLAIVLIDAWIYAWCQVRPFRYDTGLYYIQKVNWLVNYPAVKGLGNFYERLAFPHSYFLYAAFLESAYWRMGGFYISSYLLIAAVLFEWLIGMRQIFIKRMVTLAGIFRALMIFPIVLYRCTDYLIVTASPDVTVFLIMLATTAWTLECFDRLPKGHFHLFSDIFILILVLLVGLTIKTTFVIFGVTTLALIFLKAGRRNLPNFWIAAITFVFVPFFINNVLESGYIYYPLAAGAFPVIWKMPADVQKQLFSGLLQRHLDLSGWLKFCLTWDRAFLLYPLPFLFGGMAAAGKRMFDKKIFLFLLPSLMTFITMLLTHSPSRYFGASLWVPSMIAAAVALLEYRAWLSSWPFYWRVSIFLLMFLGSLWRTKMITVEPVWNLEASLYQKQILGQGFKVLEVIGDNRCWATRLPCTPRPVRGLRLIDPQHVEAGFYRLSSYDISREMK